MKIQSKFYWKFYFLITFLVLANIGFIFLFFKIIKDSDEVSLRVLVIPTCFLSLFFTLLVILIRSIKILTIENDEIEVKFLFGKTYKVNSLVGFNELINYDKFGEYKTLYFKTNSKVFKFGNREFKNYDELSIQISNKTKPAEISSYFELKIFLMVFMFTLGILLTIIYFEN